MSHPDVAGTAFVPFTVRGKPYLMRPLTLSDYAELESRAEAARPNPVTIAAAASAALPDAAAERLLRIAFEESRRPVKRSAQERVAWLEEWAESTTEGKAILFWLLLRRNHPEIAGPAQALALMDELIAEQGPQALTRLLAQFNQASGEASLGNSSGRTPGPATNPAATAGETSTAASPTATAGPPPSSMT